MKITAFEYGKTILWEDWIFRGGDHEKTYPISLLFFLIETENKKILVDVGCDEMHGFPLSEHESPVRLLERHGIMRGEITNVLLTHTHGDHADCVGYYPNATVCVHESERAEAEKRLCGNARLLTFSDSLELTDRIRMVHIGGHSVGSSVVEIKTPEKTILMCGDECYHKSIFDSPDRLARSACRESSLAFFRKYSSPEYAPIVFHDPEIVGSHGAKVIYEE